MFSSYVEFTAFGAYCNEFIDELVNSGFGVSEITSSNGIFVVRTAPRNYPAIARKAKKFRVKTRVIKRSGIYFRLRRYFGRVGILLGAFAFFGVIVLLSNFIWDVRVVGLPQDSQIGQHRILEQLSDSGIRPGVGIRSFNANQAELELMLAIEDVAWVSIERKGSRIIVKVSERAGEDTLTIPSSVPCNVMVQRSGQLVKAEVYRGELLYEIGSGVNEGDVVVSGVISNGAGGLSHVHADAVLIVESVEAVDFYQPYTSLHRAKNGHSLSNNSIIFLGLRFGGELEINRYADHVEYSESVIVPRFSGFPLPFRRLKQDYVFYDRVEVTDLPTEALDKLNRQIEVYELNFLKDAQIIEKQAEYFPDDNGIGVLVRYVFQEDVAVKSEIFIRN
ncbi:MAG: sporulation protein YqfD [Oscillospiraceae bacterium]|nr:sporulation protein YqfD [Oscillospiraceae bacterium]